MMGGYYNGYSPGTMMNGSGAWGVVMFVIGILLFLMIVAGIVLIFWALTRGTSHKSPGSSATETPLQILDKRYAAGEIDRKEYERIKNDLVS